MLVQGGGDAMNGCCECWEHCECSYRVVGTL